MNQPPFAISCYLCYSAAPWPVNHNVTKQKEWRNRCCWLEAAKLHHVLPPVTKYDSHCAACALCEAARAARALNPLDKSMSYVGT